MPISVWYAKRWGLPVGKIICCCNENNALWELVCHGQLRTDTVRVPTMLPEADVTVPDHLERLIYAYGGVPETGRYLECCRRGNVYHPSDSVLMQLRRDFLISVVSSARIGTIIPGVYRTHGRLITTGTALAYGGLLDCRAKTASVEYALVWSEEGPAAQTERLADILKVPAAAMDGIL